MTQKTQYCSESIKGWTFDELKIFVDEQIVAFPELTYEKFQVDGYGDYDSCEIDLEWTRLETVEESLVREDREKLYAKQRDERDRVAYLKLKEKFG